MLFTSYVDTILILCTIYLHSYPSQLTHLTSTLHDVHKLKNADMHMNLAGPHTQISRLFHTSLITLYLHRWTPKTTKTQTHSIPEVVHLKPFQQFLADLHGIWQEGPVGQQEVFDVGGVDHWWFLHQVHDQALRGSLAWKIYKHTHTHKNT